MTTKESIELTNAASERVIRFVKANNFYRAYNKSAWLYNKFIAQDCVVCKSFEKRLGEMRVMIGFPIDTFKRRFEGRTYKEFDKGVDVFLKDEETYNGEDYFAWFEEQPVTEKSKDTFNTLPRLDEQKTEKVLKKLMSWQLESHTLLETVAMVSEIKKEIKEIYGNL